MGPGIFQLLTPMSEFSRNRFLQLLTKRYRTSGFSTMAERPPTLRMNQADSDGLLLGTRDAPGQGTVEEASGCHRGPGRAAVCAGVRAPGGNKPRCEGNPLPGPFLFGTYGAMRTSESRGRFLPGRPPWSPMARPTGATRRANAPLPAADVGGVTSTGPAVLVGRARRVREYDAVRAGQRDMCSVNEIGHVGARRRVPALEVSASSPRQCLSRSVRSKRFDATGHLARRIHAVPATGRVRRGRR